VSKNKRFAWVAGLILLTLALGPACLAAGAQSPAADHAAEAGPAGRGDLATGMIALAAALAVGVCAMATGIAQSRIGAAGCGALAEKPETGGTVILLVAIPETMVILGFVAAVVLLFAL
jgi:V/A-type H+-transporting ATPase subunit K